jgi:hypothetical protein
MTGVLEMRLAILKIIKDIVQSMQEPCKYFKDAVMWKSEFIGVIGQANDRRHHQLSKILKGQYFRVPYSESDSLIFHDHRDPYATSIDKQAYVWRSFLSSAPTLQVEARAPTFVPGGLYPKMHLFLNIPSNLLDYEFYRKDNLVQLEIARQLPFFDSHQASAEICNLLGLVMGVPPRAVSLIEKLLNLKERKDSSQ